MMQNPRHHRRSIRLRGYDYSRAGAYFVTICTRNRECLFGEIVDGAIRLNEYGQIAHECWEWLERQYLYVDLDEWIVMPNHIHGIIMINDVCRGGWGPAPTGAMTKKPLGRLIGAFKTVSTKRLNEFRQTPDTPVWQRNYYEHIIRNEAELDDVRRSENPLKWALDSENPDFRVGDS